MMKRRLWGVSLSTVMLAVVLALLIWRGPDWEQVFDAFTYVEWWWIAVAIVLNVFSVGARCLSWHVVITQAMPPPHPRFRQTFSAFSVGLLANSVLPGRIGELARVGVLARHVPSGRGIWATLTGTVFAHRLFDLFPAALLLVYVLQTAKIPHWAATSLYLFVGIGATLFAVAMAGAKTHHRSRFGQADKRLHQLLHMARMGLGVLRAPLPAVGAALLQTLGWAFQLAAIYVAMRAFGIDESLPAAALVLALMNVATIFPLWPGNVGLVQAAVALPLVSYGVAKARGFAFGIGLQAIDVAVGAGLGLIALGREGVSLAMVRRMSEEEEEELEELTADAPVETRARARVSG
jgi:glycosyltransferase 2 family protein